MPVAKSDIKFYLTSVEPEIEQSVFSQSLGGYAAFVPSDPTKSLVYPSSILNADADFYSQSLSSSDFGNISGSEYVVINNELIKIESLTSTLMGVSDRSANQRLNSHITGDIVYGVSLNNIFNNQFNKNRKQYRCIAVKNNHSSDSANNVEVFIKQNSLNPTSKINLALEIPKNDYLSSTATGGTATQVEDSNQANLFSDNHFADANLRFLSGNNSGQSRLIESYTDSTGTFVLNESLPFDVSAGDTYEIEPGPSQRVSSGIIPPSTNMSKITDFVTPTFENPIDINVNGERDHSNRLESNDWVYIWIERSLNKKGVSYESNNVVITIRYTI